MEEIIKDENDNTKINLLFANKNYEDILLKDLLDISHQNGDINVTYVLEHHDELWDGPEGVVTKELIQQALPVPAKNHLVMHCGKDSMNELVHGLLQEVGHEEDNIYQY